MKTLNDEKEFMTQLMDMLEQQLGSHTEVVLHDLKRIMPIRLWISAMAT